MCSDVSNRSSREVGSGEEGTMGVGVRLAHAVADA